MLSFQAKTQTNANPNIGPITWIEIAHLFNDWIMISFLPLFPLSHSAIRTHQDVESNGIYNRGRLSISQLNSKYANQYACEIHI